MSKTDDGTTAKYSRPDPSAAKEWQPGDDNPASECLNCGGAISNRFARVFSNNDGEVWACHECASGTEIRGVAVANRDHESRVQDGDSDE